VAQDTDSSTFCEKHPALCTATHESNTYYEGHDEPALLFYSHTPGSGNSSVYRLRLPKDPPTLPTQDGTGGTFNFQLHPAFWFGMALCDSESAPNFTKTCVPNTDANIFDDADPSSPQYIGQHPGTAFMEMQFYPPGWVKWPEGISCDAFQWCAALNIDSLSEDQNAPTLATIFNNADCRARAGDEPVNFAFVTTNGVALSAANPLNTDPAQFTPDPTKVLLMQPGDELLVILRDTAAGFQVRIHDLTTHASGSMTASIANGFGQVIFDPSAVTCAVRPYAYHPMYSTSSEHTRVPWAAHSYNIAFSDEIGHFEYCDAVSGGTCTAEGSNDPGGVDNDDVGCFSPAASSRIAIGGCIGADADFDGVSYQTVWAGTLTNPVQDKRLNPAPVRFSSPLFVSREDDEGELQNYARVAFETNLPAIEAGCNRTTGAGCVNPPPGAPFYPIYTTIAPDDGRCRWQLGGAHIPGTQNDFGGTSTLEYGALLPLVYPSGSGPITRINDFRRILNENPCQADLEDLEKEHAER
jgi:hypothetical protein